MFTRRDVWTLESIAHPFDPTSLAYAHAVGTMRARPANDPTSWSYQAAMHGTYTTPVKPNWSQCQHATWYFLSWHRMYLYYFERIVRAAVIAVHGDPQFALPYWNYENPAPANSIPPAFRVRTLAGGGANPLFATQRAAGVNAGAQLPASAVSSAAAMASTKFSNVSPVGFGGSVTPPAHFGSVTGLIENRPHNIIHTLIGGPSTPPCRSGWMSDPNCAAQDPIFWLHHTNIDRLWTKWIASGGGRANPTDATWLNTIFHFYDEHGTQVSMKGADVLDTATQLNYVYA